ncbi:hypothetical protein CDCA_CDCA14G3760 [Cyanidium caldarium]|uniref:Uncharacterized protein n=1 Tax=Cyanidium caldarium TaxID=2771 RepID=A0AAV9J088_CYACA|nr:hypothetical protein CDCA_CDCA14G3760 [Cyanidium caldarium]
MATTGGTVALQLSDWVCVSVYFGALAGAVLLATTLQRRRARAPANDVAESDGYFLAGRSTTFFGVGASLFMSNIGSEHFVALAAAGATSGLAVSAFEWMACVFVGVVLGRLFVPLYLRARLHTVPQFLQVRYSVACRRYHSVAVLLMAVLTKISATLYSGAIVLRVLLGWPVWLSLLLLLLLTALYTILGGLQAVIFTEILQAVVLLAGGLALSVLSLRSVGGFSGLGRILAADQRRPMLNVLQWPSATRSWVEYPWPGLLFGLPALELFYWCTDQVVVQRVFAAKSETHAQGGCLLCGFLKTLVPFMMVVPGLCARVLFAEVVDAPNTAYPTAVARLLPHGLLGLMVSAMLAALMSSLASTFNSTATIVAYDFVRDCCARRALPDKTLVLIGRLTTVALCGVAIAWIPVVDHMGEELYYYIQSVISFVAPPIAVVFLLGVLWQRATATAAFTTLALGGAVGLTRFVGETVLRLTGASPPLGKLGALFFTSNFLYFAIFSWMSAMLLMVALSLCTAAPTPSQLALLFGGEAAGRSADTKALLRRQRASTARYGGVEREEHGTAKRPAAAVVVMEAGESDGESVEEGDDGMGTWGGNRMHSDDDEAVEEESSDGVADIVERAARSLPAVEPAAGPSQPPMGASSSMPALRPSRFQWTTIVLDALTLILVAQVVALFIRFR